MPNSKRLIPVTELPANDLGRQIYGQVSRDTIKAMLQQRHFIGVLARHTKSAEDSVESMQRAQSLHNAGKLAILAVMADSGDVVGMATADPELKLRRIRNLPILRTLPPAMLGWPVATRLRGYSPNIAAWTNEELVPRYTPTLLADSYDELAKPLGPAFEVFTGGEYGELEMLERMRYSRAFNPWTIEPGFQNSPPHLAIQRAGLERRESGWLDDEEDRHHALPFMTLYSLKDPKVVPA